MKFSIVIPVYNKQQTIRRAIFSIFDQTNRLADPPQLIIIDDGSTDESMSIINRIQKDNTHRDIVVYRQENSGVSAARNKGIALARNELVTFLDADDSYEPHFLDEIAHLANDYPIASVFATSYRFVNTNRGTKRNARFCGLIADQERQLLNDFFLSAATGDLPVTSSSVCIRKTALSEIGGFPVQENMGEDQTVWSQLALKNWVAISQKVCANYFVDTTESLMQTVAPDHEMPFSRRLQMQLDAKEIPHIYTHSVKKYIAGHLLDLVRRNIESGDLATAKTLIDDKRTRMQSRRWLFWFMTLKCKTVLRGINIHTYSQSPSQ